MSGSGIILRLTLCQSDATQPPAIVAENNASERRVRRPLGEPSFGGVLQGDTVILVHSPGPWLVARSTPPLLDPFPRCPAEGRSFAFKLLYVVSRLGLFAAGEKRRCQLRTMPAATHTR